MRSMVSWGHRFGSLQRGGESKSERRSDLFDLPFVMKEYYRRHLPHWQPQGAVFFVTFRLKNSLPFEIIAALREERERAKVALKQFTKSERTQQNYLDERHYFGKWDAYLDKAEVGPRWLAQPEIADIVKESHPV